jgi:pimeloyl-ACP methyl ester carboxylesterase
MTPSSPVQTDREPYLHVDLPKAPVRAIALVLHGGRARGTTPVRANQLAVLRMLPFDAALRRAGSSRGLAVARMRYLVRGWNGAAESPVGDVRWALDRLAQRFPGAAAALVGHSMGGRAAMYAAGQPSVRAVVGLAPWIEAGDPFAQLSGRRVLIAHGENDRMTSPPASAAYARQAAAAGARVGYVSIRNERHGMLRRARLWHDLTAGFVLAALCDAPPQETVGDTAANVITEVLAGNTSLVV